MIRFGTNPIAWSNDDDRTLGADIPLERCLAEAAEIGFEGIEMGHRFPTDAAALTATLAPHGLALVSGWHSMGLLAHGIEAERAAIRPHLDLLAAMGCAVCIVCETTGAIHGDPACPLILRPVLAPERWEEFCDGVEAVAETCATAGLTLVYHHHMGTIVQTADEIDRLLAGTGPATRLLLDTGHAAMAGADPAALAGRHMERIAHIHAKNVRLAVMARVWVGRQTPNFANADPLRLPGLEPGPRWPARCGSRACPGRDPGSRLRAGTEHTEHHGVPSTQVGMSFLAAVRAGIFTVPGDPEGCIDFAPVLSAAADAGYAGWLVIEAEQDPATRDPAGYQRMGLEALRRMARAAGLGTAGAA